MLEPWAHLERARAHRRALLEEAERARRLRAARRSFRQDLALLLRRAAFWLMGLAEELAPERAV